MYRIVITILFFLICVKGEATTYSTGSYKGNATGTMGASQSITGFGFTPTFYLSYPQDASVDPWIANKCSGEDDPTGAFFFNPSENSSNYWGDNEEGISLIQSLDADGVTVLDNAPGDINLSPNNSSDHYTWFASDVTTTGQFMGNNTESNVITVSTSANIKFVIIYPIDQPAYFGVGYTYAADVDNGYALVNAPTNGNGGGGYSNGSVTNISGNTFTVSNQDGYINLNSDTYAYTAWTDTDNVITGTYTGNSPMTGTFKSQTVTFDPTFVGQFIIIYAQTTSISGAEQPVLWCTADGNCMAMDLSPDGVYNWGAGWLTMIQGSFTVTNQDMSSSPPSGWDGGESINIGSQIYTYAIFGYHASSGSQLIINGGKMIINGGKFITN